MTDISEQLSTVYNELTDKENAKANKEAAIKQSFLNAKEYFEPHLKALAKVFVPSGKQSGEGFRFLFHSGKTSGYSAYKIEVSLAQIVSTARGLEPHILSRYHNDSFSVPVEFVIGVNCDSNTKDGKDLDAYFQKGKNEEGLTMNFRDGEYAAAETVLVEWLKYINRPAMISQFQRYLEEEQKVTASKKAGPPSPLG